MISHRFARSSAVALTAVSILCGTLRAWDEDGHVIVTRLAHHKLPERLPPWVRTLEVRQRLEYLANEPDRWRGQHNVHLDHANFPNHYIDLEQLEPFGLTIQTLPPFRRQFLDVLAAQRTAHPEKFPAEKNERDNSYSYNIPGLLPYEIAECMWRIASGWTTLKTYEKYPKYVTDDMIRNARENIVYDMGILSHYVGDGAQPLHLTEHHHGWVGENPKSFTTDRKFHQLIDGGVIAHHHIQADPLLPKAKAPRAVSQAEYFRDIGTYLNETFELVEPLYVLDKSGDLMKEPGKKFIEARLIEGGAMLSGIWVAAYDGSTIDDFRAERLTRAKPRNGAPG